MATSAPAKDVKASNPALLVPPDEQFWKRYSPHGEAPLSLAGSVTLHALCVGLLILFAAYLVSLFDKSSGSLPVEPVRFATGGGGGKKSGVGDGKGIGNGAENVGEPDKENQPGEEDAPKRPSLTSVELKKFENYDPADRRDIAKSETGKALARMEDSVRRKLSDGLNPGKGQGGSGSGGGKGTGTGTGEGAGTGPGTAKLNNREKRMLRWHMRFSANSGPEYLSQLRGLGAILAFPVTEGADPKYQVVHDLKPGGALKEEELSKIQRIYWIDDKPSSVRDIIGALRANLPIAPARFVAFMPEKLEKQLFDMERNYVEKVLRKKFDEDKIDDTQFRVVFKGGHYQPELISVSMR